MESYCWICLQFAIYVFAKKLAECNCSLLQLVSSFPIINFFQFLISNPLSMRGDYGKTNRYNHLCGMPVPCGGTYCWPLIMWMCFSLDCGLEFIGYQLRCMSYDSCLAKVSIHEFCLFLHYDFGALYKCPFWCSFQDTLGLSLRLFETLII